MNPGERRFASYLDDHGYRWQFEPDYQQEFELDARPATTPDFLVERDGVRVICEVRLFETTRIRERLARSGGNAALSPQEVYGALRSAMVEKAKQLRPFAGLDAPLAIVLTNPLGADVKLDEHHITAALFGNPGVTMRIDTTTGGPVEGDTPQHRLQDYGVFRSPVLRGDVISHWQNRHPHVSAVVAVHERQLAADWRDALMARHPARDSSLAAATDAALEALNEINSAVNAGDEPSGSYCWAEVFELERAGATPLPSTWFTGPRDIHYGFHSEGRYGLLRRGPSDPAHP